MAESVFVFLLEGKREEDWYSCGEQLDYLCFVKGLKVNCTYYYNTDCAFGTRVNCWKGVCLIVDVREGAGFGIETNEFHYQI